MKIFNAEEENYLTKKKLKKNQKKNKSKRQRQKLHFCKILSFNALIISLIFIIFFFTFRIFTTKGNNPKSNDLNNVTKYSELIPITNILNIELEKYDLNVLEKIEKKIKGYIQMIPDEMRFFNGLLRYVKPKKIVEIGVSRGGSSVLILNAIKDIEGAKLYSIDKNEICYKNTDKKSGFLVSEKFQELMTNWKLFLGGITAEFIETIGDGIDLVLIDTMHKTPGEMLDWLMILPFLKNGAIVVLHDVFFLYTKRKIKKKKLHTSNNLIMTYVRGDLILPNYADKVFFRNIGAIKLSPEQKNYYYQYFLALGIQWEYMPSEKDLQIMRDFFMKYYGAKYVEVFDDAVEKNKIYLNKF